VGIPASLSVAISLSKRHWQKLTVFFAGANRSATLFAALMAGVETA
jgi:hypothetical protein